MGDTLGVALVLLGARALFHSETRARLGEFAHALEALTPQGQNRLIAAATGVFLIGVISHKLRAHYVLATHAYDLGFFSNICWNTTNGNWFFSSELERNFMGVHVNWILWPISFIYKVWPGSPVMLISQAVIMTTAVPILWKLAQHLTGSFTGGALAALMLVCSPYFEHTISNDFHPDVWMLPCLFAALYAWHINQRSWLLCFSMLALLAKEDVSVVLCGFGLMLLLLRGWRLTGAALIGMALGVFYFHTRIFIPKFLDGSGESLLFTRYPFLGSDYNDFVRNVVTDPGRLWNALAYQPSKYWRLFCYLLPMGGLTLLSPLYLIPPVISVMPHLLSQANTQLSLADIYAMPSQPFLFVGAVIGAKRLLDRTGAAWAGRLAGLLFIVAGFGAFNSPRYFRSQPAARLAAFEEIKPLIPPAVTLAAQHNLQPHFETRRFIQLFPIRNSMPSLQRRMLENPEFILCDRIGNGEPGTGDQLRAAIKNLESDAAYEKIFEKENFMVFRRRKSEPPRWRAVG